VRRPRRAASRSRLERGKRPRYFGLEPAPQLPMSLDVVMFADGSKARRLGFHEHVETEAMFLKTFPPAQSDSTLSNVGILTLGG
jgi:hypothetical protein